MTLGEGLESNRSPQLNEHFDDYPSSVLRMLPDKKVDDKSPLLPFH